MTKSITDLGEVSVQYINLALLYHGLDQYSVEAFNAVKRPPIKLNCLRTLWVSTDEVGKSQTKFKKSCYKSTYDVYWPIIG